MVGRELARAWLGAERLKAAMPVQAETVGQECRDRGTEVRQSERGPCSL